MAATPGAAGMSWPQLAGAQAHVEKEEKRPKRGKKIPHVAWITPHDACVDFDRRINCKCVCIPWASMSMARQRATRTAAGDTGSWGMDALHASRCVYGHHAGRPSSCAIMRQVWRGGHGRNAAGRTRTISEIVSPVWLSQMRVRMPCEAAMVYCRHVVESGDLGELYYADGTIWVRGHVSRQWRSSSRVLSSCSVQ